jgi:hypothetical protein
MIFGRAWRDTPADGHGVCLVLATLYFDFIFGPIHFPQVAQQPAFWRHLRE